MYQLEKEKTKSLKVKIDKNTCLTDLCSEELAKQITLTSSPYRRCKLVFLIGFQLYARVDLIRSWGPDQIRYKNWYSKEGRAGKQGGGMPPMYEQKAERQKIQLQIFSLYISLPK
jgi:hypothetical protein